jgi:hypothetical protein
MGGGVARGQRGCVRSVSGVNASACAGGRLGSHSDGAFATGARDCRAVPAGHQASRNGGGVAGWVLEASVGQNATCGVSNLPRAS